MAGRAGLIDRRKVAGAMAESIAPHPVPKTREHPGLRRRVQRIDVIAVHVKRGIEAEGQSGEHLAHLFDSEVAVLHAEHARQQGSLPHTFEDLSFVPFDIEDKEVETRDASFGDEFGIGDRPHLMLHELAAFLGKGVAVGRKVRQAAVAEVVSVLRKPHA